MNNPIKSVEQACTILNLNKDAFLNLNEKKIQKAQKLLDAAQEKLEENYYEKYHNMDKDFIALLADNTPEISDQEVNIDDISEQLLKSQITKKRFDEYQLLKEQHTEFLQNYTEVNQSTKKAVYELEQYIQKLEKEIPRIENSQPLVLESTFKDAISMLDKKYNVRLFNNLPFSEENQTISIIKMLCKVYEEEKDILDKVIGEISSSIEKVKFDKDIVKDSKIRAKIKNKLSYIYSSYIDTYKRLVSDKFVKPLLKKTSINTKHNLSEYQSSEYKDKIIKNFDNLEIKEDLQKTIHQYVLLILKSNIINTKSGNDILHNLINSPDIEEQTKNNTNNLNNIINSIAYLQKHIKHYHSQKQNLVDYIALSRIFILDNIKTIKAIGTYENPQIADDDSVNLLYSRLLAKNLFLQFLNKKVEIFKDAIKLSNFEIKEYQNILATLDEFLKENNNLNQHSKDVFTRIYGIVKSKIKEKEHELSPTNNISIYSIVGITAAVSSFFLVPAIIPHILTAANLNESQIHNAYKICTIITAVIGAIVTAFILCGLVYDSTKKSKDNTDNNQSNEFPSTIPTTFNPTLVIPVIYNINMIRNS